MTAQQIRRDVSRTIKIWQRSNMPPAAPARHLRCCPSWSAVRGTMIAIEFTRYGIGLPIARPAA